MRWFGRRDRDYREEFETHIQMEERANLDLGMTPDEARRAALQKFGNALAVRETLAGERPMHFWQDLRRDLGYGARLLWRSPGLTAAAVLTLALGVGANTAIFSLVDAVLLRMLPVRDPGSLVLVRAITGHGKPDWFPHVDYEWIRDHNTQFTGVAASVIFGEPVDWGGRKERTQFEYVSGNYFSLLGVDPALGRLISPEDDAQNRPVAVLRYGYWQRVFGGRRDVIGKTLRVGNGSFQIAGVAAPRFEGEYYYGELRPEFWIPLSAQPAVMKESFLHRRNLSWLGAIARLRPGVSVAQAQAGVGPLLAALRADLHVDPRADYLTGIRIEPGAGGLSGAREQYGEPLRLLMALVAIVLLIACANVANLLLSRAAARRREFAVRLALGAGRIRLVRQLVAESLLLAALACLAGLAISQGIVSAVVSMSQVRGLDVRTNPTVLAFALGISLAAALAFGLAPALQSRRIHPWTALKDARIVGGGARRWSASNVLVVAQTALSMILLTASGLTLRTFLNLKAVNPGFDERTWQVNLDWDADLGSGTALGERMMERLSTVPGVASVSYSQFGFIGTGRNCCFTPEGYVEKPGEDKNVRAQSVSPGYFRTLGIPLVAGREFAKTDRKGAPLTAIVNETLARRYFGSGNAVGKYFGWSPRDTNKTQIVGVVKDTKSSESLRGETPRLVYFPIVATDRAPYVVEIRAAGGRAPNAVETDCRAAIRAVDPHIKITSFEPLSDVIGETLAPERMVSWLAAGLGLVALLLTSVGLYGVLAYAVARRTAEFGIRMALGAGRASVLRMVMKEGLALAGIGLALGLGGAVALSHLAASLLFGVDPRDALSLGAASVVLLVVAAAACYGPARRATSVAPVTALKYE